MSPTDDLKYNQVWPTSAQQAQLLRPRQFASFVGFQLSLAPSGVSGMNTEAVFGKG